MKKIIYLIIMLMCLFSCKKDKQVKSVIIKDEDKTVLTKIIKDTISKEKCTSSFYLEGGIPLFNFETKRESSYYRRSYLIDTLFRNFSYRFIIKNLNNNVENQNHTLEFVKHYSTKKVNVVPSTLFNRFEFYHTKNNHYVFSYAEINYSAKHYKKYLSSNYFILNKDTAIIDIGLPKSVFAKIFDDNKIILCDTILVGDEINDSWYIFKNDKLNRIIINPYID